MAYTKEQLFDFTGRIEDGTSMHDIGLYQHIILAYTGSVKANKNIGLTELEKKHIEKLTLDPDSGFLYDDKPTDVCLTDFKVSLGEEVYNSMEELLAVFEDEEKAAIIAGYAGILRYSFDIAIFDKESGSQLLYFQDQSFSEYGSLQLSNNLKTGDVLYAPEGDPTSAFEEHAATIEEAGTLFFRNPGFVESVNSGEGEIGIHGVVGVKSDFFSQTPEQIKEGLKQAILNDFNPQLVSALPRLNGKGIYVDQPSLFGQNKDSLKEETIKSFNLAIDQNSTDFDLYFGGQLDDGVRQYVYTIGGVNVAMIVVVPVTPSISPRFVGRLGDPNSFPEA